MKENETYLGSTHDLTTFLYTSNGEKSGNVEGLGPVGISILDDFVRGPEELYVLHVHACCLPHFNEVLTDLSQCQALTVFYKPS